MTDAPRGPTTEELRARAVAGSGVAARALAGRAQAADAVGDALRALVAVVEDVAWNGYAWIGVYPCVSCACEQPRHDPDCALHAALLNAQAALDKEKGERLGSPPH